MFGRWKRYEGHAGKARRGRFLPFALALSALSALLAAGCASVDVPPLRPDLPPDLRQPSGTEPDFRQPAPGLETQVKTPEEQEEAMNELESLADTHENATRKAITGR